MGCNGPKLEKRRAHSPRLAAASNLYRDDARCVGEFRTTFRSIPASVGMVRNSNPQY